MTHTRLAGGGEISIAIKHSCFIRCRSPYTLADTPPPPSCGVFLPRMVVVSPYVSLIWIALTVNSLFEYIYMHTCPKLM